MWENSDHKKRPPRKMVALSCLVIVVLSFGRFQVALNVTFASGLWCNEVLNRYCYTCIETTIVCCVWKSRSMMTFRCNNTGTWYCYSVPLSFLTWHGLFREKRHFSLPFKYLLFTISCLLTSSLHLKKRLTVLLCWTSFPLFSGTRFQIHPAYSFRFMAISLSD